MKVHQKCAINCGIPRNTSNKNSTKSKNPSVIENIVKSINWFARYRIVGSHLCRTVLYVLPSSYTYL